MKKIKHTHIRPLLTSDTVINDEDDDNELPFDPSTLFSGLAKKENDIKTDGNKIYFYKAVSRDSILNLIDVIKNTIKKLKGVIEIINIFFLFFFRLKKKKNIYNNFKNLKFRTL
jgi:hypothetical protein